MLKAGLACIATATILWWTWMFFFDRMLTEKVEAFGRHIAGAAAEAAGLHVEHPTLLDELEREDAAQAARAAARGAEDLPSASAAPPGADQPGAGDGQELSAQMRAISAQMSRLQRLPDVSTGPPPTPSPSLGVKRLVTWQSLLVPEQCAAPEALPSIPLVIDVGPRDPETGLTHTPAVRGSAEKAAAGAQGDALKLPGKFDVGHTGLTSLLQDLQLLLLQQQLLARTGAALGGGGGAGADGALAGAGAGAAGAGVAGAGAGAGLAAGRRRAVLAAVTSTKAFAQLAQSLGLVDPDALQGFDGQAGGGAGGMQANVLPHHGTSLSEDGATQIVDLFDPHLPFEPDCQFETAQCASGAKTLLNQFMKMAGGGAGGRKGAAGALDLSALGAGNNSPQGRQARKHLKRLAELSSLPPGLPSAPAEGFLGSCALIWDEPVDPLANARLTLDGFLQANMYGDVAYEERFEAAVKSKDTAVLCPSRPGPKGMTCRFMRKAAKSPVVKSSARRAASQMEFRISPSAYDEARISARRMHDLLSDGQETWREWLGPEKDMDGAWGFVGDGSHALTAAILMYRTGWCTQLTAYGLPGLPSSWVKIPPGDKGHAVLRPPHAWSANTERKLIARVEQERFALSVLQHAGRICFHP